MLKEYTFLGARDMIAFLVIIKNKKRKGFNGMKLNMKRLVAMGLAFVLVMSSLTPSYASAAKKNDDVADIKIEADVVEAETTEVAAEAELADVLVESALSSTVVTTVDVSECAMTQEEAEAVTEEALADEAVAALTDVTYTTNEEGVVTEINVLTDESVAKAAAEIEAVAEGDSTSELTKEDVLNKYIQLQYFYESCPQYFGVPVPYFVEKGPINSLLAVIAYDFLANGLTWEYAGMDLDGDGNIDLSLDMLAMVIDGYMNVLYVCLNGDPSGLPSMVPKLTAAVDDALAQIDSKNMTTEEKLLVLNDWLANWCTFDMAQIENKDQEKNEQENFAYMIETTMFGGLVGADYMFGGPGMPKTICMGYTAAYTYLVQRAFPEIYLKDGNAANWEDPANWKTKQELNDTEIKTLVDKVVQEQAKDEAGNLKYEFADENTAEENKIIVLDKDGKEVPSDVQKLDEYGKPLYELATEDSVNVVAVQNDKGEQMYQTDENGEPVLDADGNTIPLFYDADKPVMEPKCYDKTKPVMEDVTIQVEENVKNTPTYMIDFVQIKWDARVTMLGEEKPFNETHFFNAVRTDNTTDTWYYIDPCYNDIYVECMGRNRVETDGNMTHSYFLISDTSLRDQFEGNFKAIDTLYQEKATDTKYENEWFTSTTGPIVKDADYFYYVINSTIKDASVDDSSFDISNLLNGKDKLMARNRKTGEEIVLLDYTEGTGTTTGGTAISGADAVMAAEEEALDEKYASVIHTVAIKGGTLYLNVGNIIFTYDLSTGEIKPFKEYNVVSATQDTTNPFAGMSFSVVPNGSGNVVYTVENHPLAAIAIKSDGKLYASVATNFAKASAYTVEETNYNKDYINYGRGDQSFSQGGDNDNDEFLWSANFVESFSLDCNHSYEKVEIAASCTEGAYTENRCTACGAIEAGTKTAVEGSEPTGHHYVKHNETYYNTADGTVDGNKITGTAYVCVDCLDAHEELPADATLDHMFAATAYNWSEDNGACTADLACTKCAVKKLDCVEADTTKTKTVNCTIGSEFVEGYNCARGGQLTYTATWTEGAYTDSTSKTVDVAPGTHAYDEGVYTWNDDLTACSVVFTCKVCTDEAGNPTTAGGECTITSETTEPDCLTDGKTVYTAAYTLDGVVRTDNEEVIHPALGHDYADVKATSCDRCGAGKPFAEIAFVEDAGEKTYTGNAIKLADTTVEVTKGTGDVSFTYYTDEDCTEMTSNNGAAPTAVGTYYVKATVSADESYQAKTTGETYVLTVNPRKVASLAAVNQAGNIKVTWAKRAEATGYILYRKVGTGAYKQVKKFTKNTTLSYTDSNISQNKTYTYKIVSYKGELVSAEATKAIVRAKITAVTNNNGSVKLTWTKVSNAAGYKVYRKAQGASSYALLKNIKGNTANYTDKTAKSIKNGNKSEYYVVAYYKNTSSTVLKTNTATNYYVARPTLSSVTGTAKNAITVKWKKNASATGYQITYSTSSNFKNAKTIKITNKNTVSRKITGLKKNTKYYVKIRAYKTNTNYVSAWSGYKSVKTKAK